MRTGPVSLLALTVPIASLAGLFVGSFLNVVIYRTPLGLSVVNPRSFCPGCRRQLQWWENLPVVSWSFLRGRCRTCHKPISIRYPLVELGTAAIFGLITWAWEGTIYSVAYSGLAASLIAITLIEYGGKRSPLSVAAVGVILGEMVIAAGSIIHRNWHPLIGSLGGLAVALFIFALLRVNDPECRDSRGYGRTALLIAGCWMGPLGADAIIVGAISWIIFFFVCSVAAWSVGRSRCNGDKRSGHSLFDAPLVTALCVAVAVSLFVAG